MEQELVKRGALVSQCNKYGETALDKCKPYLAEILRGEPIYKKEEAFFSRNSVNLKTRGQMTTI